ncbi:MAG: glycosyltransferase family 9 protein [Taibaiella sp.]|nr:glycosyltransferase family 9 protein [Taibaiella sp.]
MLRFISVTLRSLQAKKQIRHTLDLFRQWKQEVTLMKPPKQVQNKLLIIRLDDIGDYILFRNNLQSYRDSAKWVDFEITLLGHALWKDYFDFADSGIIDKAIWVNKNQYFEDSNYRKCLWQALRDAGYSVVICPSRVRPLLIDDMCMLAAGAPVNIASANDFNYPEWNAISDSCYQQLYGRKEPEHELYFNQAFANWSTGVNKAFGRPQFPLLPTSSCAERNYIICFLGASAKSKRWPAHRWIEFIGLCKGKDFTIVLAGGKGDVAMADEVAAATAAANITGTVSLLEMAGWLARADAVVSNDTMAAHLSVALSRPTVMLCNGDNYYKFGAYKQAGVTGVRAVLPDVFLKKLKRHGSTLQNYVAVTKDISTITAGSVLEALCDLVNE